MKRRKVIAIITLVIIAALAAAVFAQQPRRQRADRPGQRESGRKMLERLADRLTRELKLTEEEKAVVMPKIRELMILKLRRMPGLPGLRELHRNQSASDEEITAALAKFRDSLAKARKKITEAEKELMDMPEITPRRELVLTTIGVLDNGAGLPPAITGRGMPGERGRPGRPREGRGRPGRRQER